MRNAGDGSDQFSVEIHHSGWFCGVGTNRSYMEEHVDTFDGCERKTFCCALLDWMVKNLGYATPKNGFAMYWCIPGRSIVDGLQVVSLEMHARAMEVASEQDKVVVLFVDHDNVLEKQLWDDVLLQPVQLPGVISPVKNNYVHEQRCWPSDNKLPTFGEHLFNMYPAAEDAVVGDKATPVRRNIFAENCSVDAVLITYILLWL